MLKLLLALSSGSNHSWQGMGVPYGMQGIKLRSAVCKANMPYLLYHLSSPSCIFSIVILGSFENICSEPDASHILLLYIKVFLLSREKSLEQMASVMLEL